METVLKFVIATGAYFAAFVAGSILTGVLVYFLWNAVIPQLFGLPIISFIQAIYLSLLCALLFKSFGTK